MKIIHCIFPRKAEEMNRKTYFLTTQVNVELSKLDNFSLLNIFYCFTLHLKSCHAKKVVISQESSIQAIFMSTFMFTFVSTSSTVPKGGLDGLEPPPFSPKKGF